MNTTSLKEELRIRFHSFSLQAIELISPFWFVLEPEREVVQLKGLPLQKPDDPTLPIVGVKSSKYVPYFLIIIIHKIRRYLQRKRGPLATGTPSAAPASPPAPKAPAVKQKLSPEIPKIEERYGDEEDSDEETGKKCRCDPLSVSHVGLSVSVTVCVCLSLSLCLPHRILSSAPAGAPSLAQVLGKVIEKDVSIYNVQVSEQTQERSSI